MKRFISIFIFLVSATLSLDAQEFVVPAGETESLKSGKGYDSGAFYALPINESDPTANVDGSSIRYRLSITTFLRTRHI